MSRLPPVGPPDGGPAAVFFIPRLWICAFIWCRPTLKHAYNIFNAASLLCRGKTHLSSCCWKPSNVFFGAVCDIATPRCSQVPPSMEERYRTGCRPNDKGNCFLGHTVTQTYSKCTSFSLCPHHEPSRRVGARPWTPGQSLLLLLRKSDTAYIALCCSQAQFKISHKLWRVKTLV